MPNQSPSKEKLDALLVYVELEVNPHQFTRTPQLGLYYVAQHACDAGYNVRIDTLSANDHVITRVSRLLKQYDCNILGLYISHDNLWVWRRYLPQLMQEVPGLRVVLGGPQATISTERTLSILNEAVCAVVGEGEETFVELLGLRNWRPGNLGKVRGIAFMTDLGVQWTPARPYLRNLDVLSIPQRHLLDIDFDPNFAPNLITGRGCQGHCAFCFEGREPLTKLPIRQGDEEAPALPAEPVHPLRFHSVERTLEEFDYLVRTYKAKYVTIVDDTFVTGAKRLSAFCEGLLSRYDGQVKWFCEARVDNLTRHPDLLPLMVRAGLLRIQVGVESGCQEVLDAYKKGTTLNQMREVVDMARESGLLSLFGNFIIGGAFETQQTYEKSFEFAVELLKRAPGCASFGTSLYTPYPGTPMAEHPEAFDIEIIDGDAVMSVGDQHALCRTKSLSRFQLLAKRTQFDLGLWKAMAQVADQLSRAAVSRQFEALHRWGVQTEWCEVLCNREVAGAYFRSILGGYARPFGEIPSAALPTSYPVRIVKFMVSKDEKLIVENWHGKLCELDPFDASILELCAGKLSLRDVINAFSNRYPTLEKASLTEAIIRRFERFDEQCFVVWSCDQAETPISGQQTKNQAALVAAD